MPRLRHDSDRDAVPVMLPDHGLDESHLCEACRSYLSLAFAVQRPWDSLVAFEDGGGLRLTVDEVTQLVRDGAEIARNYPQI